MVNAIACYDLTVTELVDKTLFSYEELNAAIDA